MANKIDNVKKTKPATLDSLQAEINELNKLVLELLKKMESK